MTTRSACLLLGALACRAEPAATPAPGSAAVPPAPAIGLLPEALTWVPAPPNLPAGAEVAVLEGDPRRAGLFTMRVKLPAGYELPPHTHAQDERVTVLSGSVHVGFGKTLDARAKAGSKRYGPGSYYVNPTPERHFLWTDEPVVLQITTHGPWTLEYVVGAEARRRLP
jgi:quercetin dioxygenase-like cupin family protein